MQTWLYMQCRVSWGQHQHRQWPLARGGVTRVLRHAAPGIPRHAHMSQRTILYKQGVGFSFTFVHTRCALQTLSMLSAKIHTHIGTTVKSIFALSRHGHVTLHILHYFTRRSPRRAQFVAQVACIILLLPSNGVCSLVAN